MSDRVTNIEIEDVLSSIRRLVMEGGSSAASPERKIPVVEPEMPVEPAPTGAGKFVLTPALRVAEPVSLRPAEMAQIWPADDPLPLDILPDAQLPGGDTGEDAGPSDFVEVDVEVGAEPDGIPVNAAFIDRRLRLSDMAAGLEAAVTAQPDDWEPDGSEEVPVMDWSQATPEDAPVFRSRHAAPFRLEQRIAPASASVANDHPPFRHAAASEDEGDDPDGIARFEAIAEEPMDDELAAFIGAEKIISEEMLRNLVVEIVRQELQGTLGERITRNVRKLVRREIAQALNNPEYE